MLIDLKWTKNYANTEYIKKFNTQDNNLVVEFAFPEGHGEFSNKNVTWHIAERVHIGVYWSRDLHNSIETFTEWNVEHPWIETHEIYAKIQQATLEEKQRLRDYLLRKKSSYGNADNLKQIFRYGKQFITSPNFYVLEICPVDLENNERFLEKNGEYIGKKRTRELTKIVHFNFHKLVKKQ